MQILIKQAKIINSGSSHDGQIRDLLVADGVIKQIAPEIKAGQAEVIHGENLHISLGWVDLKATFCDPGYEHKEDVSSGLMAAQAGGYTHVALTPSTSPVVDGKSQIEYLKRRAEGFVCTVHPIGALTAGMNGESLSEMFDMHQNGVQLFSDDNKPVSAGILYRSLLYTRNFGARTMTFPRTWSISGKGMVNEGMASTLTGLKADPSVSEVIDIERTIRLAEYTQGSVHITGVSTAEGVKLIQQAKKQGLDITADVHLMNLVYNEDAVCGFDSNLKVMPPLRFESDRQALWQGVKDGSIDAIVSDHRPTDKEEKDVEFDVAEFGCIQLQSSFGALGQCKEFDLSVVVRALSESPREILNLKNNRIEEGELADLTIFTPSNEWIFDTQHIHSKTKFSPFVNKTLKGKAIAVINNSKFAYCC